MIGSRRKFQPLVMGAVEQGHRSNHVPAGLPATFLDFCPALTDFELWVAFANNVDAPTSFDDLAIRVTVLQSANTADNLHESLLSNRKDAR